MVKSNDKAKVTEEVTEKEAGKGISDRQIALILAALTLALYLRTLAPGLLAGDPGEFQVAAWTLGLSHPTGYPLYMLLGGGWQRLLGIVGIAPSTALNAFSALVGAATVAVLYLLMIDWLPVSLVSSPLVRRFAAALTALLYATNPTVWNQSLIAEVYTLHGLFIVLIFLAAHRLRIKGQEDKKNGRQEESVNALPLFLSSPLLFFIVGLSLTHHAMTLLLLPGLLLFLILHFRKEKNRSNTLFLSSCLLVLLLPLLLYLYIPLRSGAEASPWYHQNLGGEILSLYDNSWTSFVDFISGRSISVGFRTIGDAMGQLSFAFERWQIHFTAVGLVLIVIGLVALIVQRNWSVLLLTGVAALLQQIFNLFYNIGDIHVYYIPLYLIGSIWCGFAAAWIGEWGAKKVKEKAEAENGEERDKDGGRLGFGALIVLFLFFLPLQQVRNYQSVVDQSQNRSTRQAWERILAAQPPEDAILISNDRNEIVPLFYLQSVDKQAVGMAGLFPLMAADARFADIGATIDTAFALGAGRPVYLIKPMPGLAAKFALAERTPPLVEVLGPATAGSPAIQVDVRYGPLTLLGYDWSNRTNGRTKEMEITLHWRVEEALDADYTTTVQLYDETGQKIAQDDRPPGAEFYPTSLWKTGEILLDRHTLAGDGITATKMLVGMYVGPNFDSFAPPLEIELAGQ